MEKIELLNSALGLIVPCTHEEALHSRKSWMSHDGALAVKSLELFNAILEELYLSDKNIIKRFSRKTTFKEIEKKILIHRKSNILFSKEQADNIFSELLKVESQSLCVLSPISGIRLTSENGEFSVFKFGRSSTLQLPLANDSEYYIQIKINDVYDNEVAISCASNAFDDFSRLVTFISGKNDNSIVIKIGLPVYPRIGEEKMYVETSSYQLLKDISDFPNASVNNRYVDIIPIDHEYFKDNSDFSKLLSLYEKKHSNLQMSDIEKRIVNSSLAIGESMSSENTKNSIIYTCIALEILFSFDDGSIFQKSIGDRLADTFVFIVANDKESRINTSKIVKKVYSMRSSLVHGGDKTISNDYILVNILMRAAISELLNNEKYKSVKKIDDLYDMVKSAQYSYEHIV